MNIPVGSRILSTMQIATTAASLSIPRPKPIDVAVLLTNSMQSWKQLTRSLVQLWPHPTSLIVGLCSIPAYTGWCRWDWTLWREDMGTLLWKVKSVRVCYYSPLWHLYHCCITHHIFWLRSITCAYCNWASLLYLSYDSDAKRQATHPNHRGK